MDKTFFNLVEIREILKKVSFIAHIDSKNTYRGVSEWGGGGGRGAIASPLFGRIKGAAGDGAAGDGAALHYYLPPHF